MSKLFLLAVGAAALDCAPTDNARDCKALNDVYERTGHVLTAWATGAVNKTSFCDWDGTIRCDYDPESKGMVVDKLLLTERQLSGEIDWATGFTRLTTLDIGNNQLSGAFPKLPKTLTYLDLDSNTYVLLFFCPARGPRVGSSATSPAPRSRTSRTSCTSVPARRFFPILLTDATSL